MTVARTDLGKRHAVSTATSDLVVFVASKCFSATCLLSPSHVPSMGKEANRDSFSDVLLTLFCHFDTFRSNQFLMECFDQPLGLPV